MVGHDLGYPYLSLRRFEHRPVDNRVLGTLLEVFSGNVLIAHDEVHVLWIPRGGAGNMEILDKRFQSPIRVVHRLVAFCCLHREIGYCTISNKEDLRRGQAGRYLFEIDRESRPSW